MADEDKGDGDNRGGRCVHTYVRGEKEEGRTRFRCRRCGCTVAAGENDKMTERLAAQGREIEPA